MMKATQMDSTLATLNSTPAPPANTTPRHGGVLLHYPSGGGDYPKSAAARPSNLNHSVQPLNPLNPDRSKVACILRSNARPSVPVGNSFVATTENLNGVVALSPFIRLLILLVIPIFM